MGKKVFNAKARQKQHVVVDNSATKKIKIDFDYPNASVSGYDEANPLVLPSQKRKTKIKIKHQQNIKILSKKRRKHLEAIVNKKKKKEERVSLLEALAQVQIPKDELQKYTSISQVQTLGLKKLHCLDEMVEKAVRKKAKAVISGRMSSIAGMSKRKRQALLADYKGTTNDSDEDGESKPKKKNLNVVGLDDEDSSEDDDVDDVEENMGDEEKKEEDKKEENKDDEKMDITENEKEIRKNLVETKKEETALTKHFIISKPTVFVPVNRNPEIQTARLRLPILAEEQQIMETINENSIVIIAGETGSGKTTQVPQFLYEAGYGEKKLIGITEPRRVAAIAMSKRVACEMNLSEKEVSYLIRFEGNVTDQTRIKFMTDGVLLKEIESDFLLLKYSVIILDEAHERSAYTDILLGLLSRIVPLRLKRGNPLKLIVMSATLRVEDFTKNTRLFRTSPPLIKVEARQFPVQVHFQKNTYPNYVQEAFKKTVKIHAKLPEGGILIFLTGQKEVNQLVRKLRNSFPYIKPNQEKMDTSTSKGKNEEEEEDENEIEFDMKKAIHKVKKSKKRFVSQIALPKIDLDQYKLPSDDTEADLHEVDNDSDIENIAGDEYVDDYDDDDDDDETKVDENVLATKQPLWVLPLYSLLSLEKQNRIFQPPPENCRLCIVATNVAETSLTIPNIKYVVDSGRQKSRIYDKITGVSAFVVTFTSKASAEQRAGRAGRVSAGHCYRLYSSAVFNDEFVDFSTPDIKRKPVDDLMLQMRCMGIDRVINFPFPSPPDQTQLEAAEKRLVVLGALDPSPNPDDPKCVPPVSKIGYAISRFPVAPRFGKMLALSHQKDLLKYTVCIAAALTVPELLVESWQKPRQNRGSTGNYLLLGDPMVLLRTVGAAEYASSKGDLKEFCNEHGLRHKAITEIRKLRVQLTNEINLNISNVNLCIDPEMQPPSDMQARFLRQILLAGMGDRVAHKISLDDITDKDKRRKFKYAYNCLDMEDPVYIHSSSVLKQKLPEWIVYQEVYEIQNGDSTKLFIRGITAIEPEWLLLYVPLLCNVRNIKEDPLPRYSSRDGKVYCYVDATFGKAAWEIPLGEIEMPFSDKACCFFGMFLLNGEVFPKLLQYKPKLKAAPSSLIRSWADLNENVVKFKRNLIIKKIYTKQKLLDEWEKNRNFLLDAYCNLLYDDPKTEISLIWPPIESDSK